MSPKLNHRNLFLASIFFGTFSNVYGFSLSKREVPEGSPGASLGPDTDPILEIKPPVQPDAKDLVLKNDDYGMKLVQHNNPYNPGERRLQQAIQNRFTSGQIPTSCSPDLVCNSSLYRSYDGSCNNLQRPSWGQASIPFRRLLPPKLSMVQCGSTMFDRLPTPRLASLNLIQRSENDPQLSKSMYVMIYGQLIDHDITLTPLRSTSTGDFLDCCKPENRNSNDCCPIQAPPNDFFYGQSGRPRCIPFLRSRLTVQPGSDCRRLPDVENANTAFIDLSFLYGSDEERATSLRSMTGGKLKSTLDKRNRTFPFVSSAKGIRMMFGDNRGDVHPGFTLLTTVYLRNHNKIASSLASMHPDWNDEKVFQESRKINIAIHQQVTYTEFMNELLGWPNDVSVNEEFLPMDFYDVARDPTISLGFSTAAYRLHTFVGGHFILADSNLNKVGGMLLRDVFHKPLALLENSTYDDLMRGLSVQSVHEFNNVFSPEMTEWLFKNDKDDFGMDIVALNIQRARDHRIHGYTAYKSFCGLGTVQTWQDLGDLIPQDRIQQLMQIYRKPEDIDLYIGQNMELSIPGSLLGPTAHCIVREQFEALKRGDRFFYTHPIMFTPDQLNAIKQVKLTRLLCDHADDAGSMKLPWNAFKPISDTNPAVSCSDTFLLPPLDLRPWI